MTSDTLDIRSPISLTATRVQMRAVATFVSVLCNLSHVNSWYTPCPSQSALLRGSGAQKPSGNRIFEFAKPESENG